MSAESLEIPVVALEFKIAELGTRWTKLEAVTRREDGMLMR